MQTAWGQISSNYLSVVCLDSNIDVKHLVGTYVHKEVGTNTEKADLKLFGIKSEQNSFSVKSILCTLIKQSALGPTTLRVNFLWIS